MLHSDFLRFKNGGAKIYDFSEICEKSFADKFSTVKNCSSVWDSRLVNAQISRSTVTNAAVKNSYVHETCLTGGKITDSLISCEIITGKSVVKKSIVSGASRIAHLAYLKNVKISNLTVKGDARLLNWNAAGDGSIFNGLFGYIARGVWSRPPRIVRFPFEVTVTESVPGFAFVACYEFPIERWLKIGERYGKARGWSPEQVDQVRQFLKYLLENPL